MQKTVLAAVAALFAWGSTALAEEFPTRPVTIIVPFAAGGPSDAMARILAEPADVRRLANGSPPSPPVRLGLCILGLRRNPNRQLTLLTLYLRRTLCPDVP